MTTLNEFERQVRDLALSSSVDIPLNFCILDQDGTAKNFSPDKVYMFFSGGPDGIAVANIVIKPEE
jgi:hypothetical protein